MVLITQSVSGFYKAFGQTFIHDDHLLSLVGSVSSVFNCLGEGNSDYFMEGCFYTLHTMQ